MLLLASAVTAEGADATSEVETLEGAWRAVEAERDGVPANELVGHRLELVGDRFGIWAGSKSLYAGTYTVEPTAQPARIDFRHEQGEATGRLWEGIYRLEGGRLWICDDAPDTSEPRPTSFATSPGSGHVLLTFER